FGPLAGLPHVVGMVTNLAADLAEAGRAQEALEGELDGRQQLLHEAGCESLRQLHAAGPPSPGGPPAPPYLVVVVDEFGELLEARPELVDTFARVGRLGRSLGVHLLLASQRLDEERLRGLESHLRYRLAL